MSQVALHFHGGRSRPRGCDKIATQAGQHRRRPKNKRGRSPLSLAAEAGHEAVIRLLLERDDINVNSEDRSDCTPLSWAIRTGHEAVAELILERDDINADLRDKWVARLFH